MTRSQRRADAGSAVTAPRRAWFGVRARSSLAAVLVVALALLVGGAVLLFILDRTLISGVQSGAATRASDIARQLQADGAEGLDAELRANATEGTVVQVVTSDGQVVASSSTRASTRPLSGLRPAPDEVALGAVERVQLADEDDPYLLLVRGVERQGRTYFVVVAASIAAQRESVRTVRYLLAAGSPVLLLLVGAATWVLVGRSLAPVERIRARVAGIGGAHLDERVPVPRSRDEIARLAATMNQMLERLQLAQATQRRFVADASHELRSPLATLGAVLDVAAADPSGTAWRDLSAVMSGETSRMGRLVEDLLLLARSDDQGVRLALDDVDLDDMVAEEADRIRLAGRVSVQVRPLPARVRGDRAKLGQLLRNLADNAARHAEQQVRITSSEDDSFGCLVVEDDGAGVPEAERERVFGRFVRLDDSRARESGGSGLGLAIVQEIVKAHGGSVWIEESDLGGCRVVVRLPA